MRRTSSDLPSLFILYMTTENDEVICINENGLLILPRYEFDAVYGSEAITTAVGRQMEKAMGYRGMRGKINLADAGQHYEHEPQEMTLATLHTDEDEDMDDAEFERMLKGIDPKKTPAELAMENDCAFRVCVALECVPCERELEDLTMSPYARWANELFTYQPFSEWDAARKTRAAQEKKVACVPIVTWDAMIAEDEIKDRKSIMATKIAKIWITTAKPPSFARKTPRKEKTSQKQKSK